MVNFEAIRVRCLASPVIAYMCVCVYVYCACICVHVCTVYANEYVYTHRHKHTDTHTHLSTTCETIPNNTTCNNITNRCIWVVQV